MALDAATPLVIYAGNGSSSTFNVADDSANPIVYQSNSQIKVATYVASTDVLTNLVEGTDYTLAGTMISGVVSNGVVTKTDSLGAAEAVPTGTDLLIWRETALDQPTSFTTGAALSTHTAVADRHRRIDQELAEELDRALKLARHGTYYEAGSKKIINLADPTDDQDAATKAYVDINMDAAAAAAAAALASEVAAAASEAAAAVSETNTYNYYQQTLSNYVSPDGGETFSTLVLDDISSGFNGVTVTFSLALAAIPVIPASAASILVFINGIYQYPGIGNAYTVTSDEITFVTAPTSGDTCLIIALQNSGSTGPTGARGGIDFTFSTTTTMADPGSGAIRFDNATFASITAIAIDDNNADAVDISAFITSWADSDSTTKGTLVVQSSDGNDATVAIFTITGLTDNSGWTQLAVTPISGTIPSDGELVVVSFTQTGDKGTTGPGTGDMLAATYDPATISEQLVGLTAAQTLTNKTLTDPVFDNDLLFNSFGAIDWNSGTAKISESTGALLIDGNDWYFRRADGTVASMIIARLDTHGPASIAGRLYFNGKSSTGVSRSYAEISGYANKDTNGAEQGDLIFYLMKAGTLTQLMQLNIARLFPVVNDGLALGSGTLAWSDLFLANGGVINFNNGDATLTHSAGLLTSNVPISVGTSNAITAGTIELGAASDTTLSRSSAGNVAVEGNLLYRAGGTDVPVADGGTGLSSTTAYAVLCGGTTSTAALQSVASVGTSGYVLTSNGAGALPTFQAAAGGGWTLLGTLTTTSGTSHTLSSLTLTSYKTLMIVSDGVSFTATSKSLILNHGGTLQFSPLLVSSTNVIAAIAFVDLTSGAAIAVGQQGAASVSGTTATSCYAAQTGLSTASTSLNFVGTSSATFDAGVIRVYAM